MLRRAKDHLRHFLRRAGYELVPIADAPTLQAALARVARRAPVSTIIDVGASDGRWTRVARGHFPGARCLLVEAQAEAHGEALRRFAESERGIEVILAAAGSRQGQLFFDASDPFGGVARYARESPSDIVVPVTTIDSEVTARGLPPPYLVKLDTHGFELAILEGARRTLAGASVLVIEAYNFDLLEGSVRFPELCSRLEYLGFRTADLADPLWRPRDGMLWQLDLVFMRSDRPEYALNKYS